MRPLIKANGLGASILNNLIVLAPPRLINCLCALIKDGALPLSESVYTNSYLIPVAAFDNHSNYTYY
ncbi:hypothetical protein WG66_009481 [Moniliophthora roreri]|nr:hypothetical protein WG66_009481 [Moniliophthora roreri]